MVYSTLEPCFKRNSPKIGCCKRIAKARIKKVYVGTGDPFPSVNGKGIKYLVDHGIEVEQYPQELQKEIERQNADKFDPDACRQLLDYCNAHTMDIQLWGPSSIWPEKQANPRQSQAYKFGKTKKLSNLVRHL